MARIDIKTAQAETTAGTWHELENVTGPFGVIPIATAVKLCIGYTTPSLALATTISVGSAFKRQVSPTGPIYIQTASTSKVSWYSALINSAVVYSSYAIINLEPALVFDFKGNYFRKSATDSTFGASITHAASSNATMVDSGGLLKWRPHNLLTHSGDLTNAGWTALRVTVATGQNDFEGNPTAFKITPTAVSGSHAFYKSSANTNLVNGILSTVTIDLKADGYNFFSVASENNSYAIINLSNGTASLNTGSVSPTVTSLGNGWYRCSITSSLNQQEVFSVVETPQSVNHGATTFTGDGTSGVLVAYPHSFRSDLGGMVNNPNTTSSYVPTTSAVVYAPRRGHHSYNGSAWVNEGILHESEARTNLLTYSNDFTNAVWAKSAVSNTANAGVSPDGTSNANKVVPDTSSGFHYTYQALNFLNADHSFSVYVASSGYGFATICAGTTFNTNYYAVVIDLSDGTQTALYSQGTHSKTVAVEAVGSFYRVTISGDGERFYVVGASDTGTYTPSNYGFKSFQGNGTSGILVYGAQAEAGATPSSYIPTTSATVTRAAEALTVPAANLPYDSTNMSIQMDGKMTYADTSISSEVEMYRWLLDGTNYINSTVQAYSSKTGEPHFNQRDSATALDSVVGSGNTYAPSTNVLFNIAVRHGSTFINAAHEGTLLTANTTPTALPDLSAADLILGSTFMGTIGQFRMWDEDITDAGITEAST